jgi:hypothetical protein
MAVSGKSKHLQQHQSCWYFVLQSQSVSSWPESLGIDTEKELFMHPRMGCRLPDGSCARTSEFRVNCRSRSCPTRALGVTCDTLFRLRIAAIALPPSCTAWQPDHLPRLRHEREKAYSSYQEIDVQKLLLSMIGVLTMGSACGCNGAKSPAAVAADVAAARRQASTEVTDTRNDAAENVASAAANVDGSSQNINDTSAKAAYDVAVAQADGDHNVAIQQCSALAGEPQKSCKDRADALYDQAKTHANVTRLSKLQ